MLPLSDVCKAIDAIFADLGTKDISNNGLQVEANQRVSRIAFAVDAAQATIDAAAAAGADLLVVHHGLSWGGGWKYLTAIDGRRVQTLFTQKLSLYACHLPLDAHPVIGNNAQLGKLLGLTPLRPFCPYEQLMIGRYGRLAAPTPLSELAAILERSLPDCTCRLFPAPASKGLAHCVGIVAGSGADAIELCPSLGIDTLVTGEMRHQYAHPARELGVNVISGGHYATECIGIMALQERLQQSLPVPCVFINEATGL
ncbi:MAG: Nif3-like dinuclear metal center hexameric protein [Lentisphaerae bacterium]|jgi:dinuclear metal center YbgI/SA1388 family protein|nr:Nif3-like dinuclear metal center hexameric protein [Lentisphaerota bacterium]